MILWTGITLPLIGVYANLTGSLSIPLTFAAIAVDQIVGVVLSAVIGRRLFAKLADSISTKQTVIMGLLIYTIIPLWGFVLRSQAEFFLIGWMVGTVQGGTQALSRSVFSSLSPRAKSGEFFGLYGLSEKFAGILGPLLYSIVGVITGDPRASVLSISVFFAIGIFLLTRVDEVTGAKVASTEEAEIELTHSAD